MTRTTGKKAPVRLQPEAMVSTALTLLDEVGLDGLTMRRIAEALGVQNPALYWHFKNKQALLDRMAETMLRDAFASVAPPTAGQTWADFLTDLAHRFRRAMMSRRDGARVLAGADLTGSDMLSGLDAALGVLKGAGFRSRDALFGVLAIFDYTLGATFEQQADPVQVSPETGLRPPGTHPLRERIDAARLPTLAAVFDELVRDDPDFKPGVTFEAGLELLLDGLRGRLAAVGG